jgi:hypothetical protein
MCHGNGCDFGQLMATRTRTGKKKALGQGDHPILNPGYDIPQLGEG